MGARPPRRASGAGAAAEGRRHEPRARHAPRLGGRRARGDGRAGAVRADAELEAQWKEYRDLARATPPPTAYTPHLWRQYEAWTLRHEQHILASDATGAGIARSHATEVRLRIEAARSLDIAPQTLALQAAVGGRPWTAELPASFKAGIAHVASKPPADRAKEWATARDTAGDTEANRLLWCRALTEWTADDPLPRLPVARDLVPLVSDGFAIRLAELNFLAMLARDLPPQSKAEVIGPLLTHVLRNRLKAEQAAALLGHHKRGWPYHHPYAECLYKWAAPGLAEHDAVRRESEDLCFATDEVKWKEALDNATWNDALRAAEKAGRHLLLTAPAPAETSARPDPPTK